MVRLAVWSLLAGVIAACAPQVSSTAAEADETGEIPDTAETMVVAGGCFWCVEADFEKQEGVYEVVSGYSGGTLQNATYKNHEGHREVAQIYYDPSVTDYATLVDKFLRSVDVTDDGGQFCDRGFSYTTAIHYETDEQREIAESAVAEAEAVLGQDIVTPVLPRMFFVEAEDYHQDYYKKNPVRYRYYRAACGRNARLKELWGDAALVS